MDSPGLDVRYLEPLSAVFRVRLIQIVDHDVERGLGSFPHRFVAFGDDQVSPAAQFQDAEFLVAEYTP